MTDDSSLGPVDFEEKLQFLFNDPRAIVASGKVVTTKTALLRAIGLQRGNLYREGRAISNNLKDLILSFYAVPLKSTCAEAFRSESVEKFRQEFELLHKDIELPLARFSIDRTKKCADDFESELGSLELIAPGNVSPPNALSLWAYFTLHCMTVPPVGGDGGVSQGYLEFDLGDAVTVEIGERFGCPDPDQIDNASLRAVSTDLSRPTWFVRAIEGDNIGLITTPSAFLLIKGATHGTKISVRFRAANTDIHVRGELPKGGGDSIAKLRIIEWLQKKKLLPGRDDQVIIAKKTITLKDRLFKAKPTGKKRK